MVDDGWEQVLGDERHGYAPGRVDDIEGRVSENLVFINILSRSIAAVK
jgi:hypothetical protein